MKSMKKKHILPALATLAVMAAFAPQAYAAGTNLDTHSATVQLWNENYNKPCSGVFVGTSLILTAKHCVVSERVNPATNQAETKVENNIRIYKSNAGTGTPIAVAEVVWYHEGSTRNNPDVAILQTWNYSTYDFAPIASYAPSVGESLQVCGAANRNSWGSVGENYCGDTKMTGTTSYPTDYILSKPLQTANGDSGGPAYNSRGQVVGIVHGDDYQSNYLTPLQGGNVRYWLSIYGAAFQ